MTMTATIESPKPGAHGPPPPVKRGRGRPRKGEEPVRPTAKKRKSKRLPKLKVPREQFTIRMRADILRAGKIFAEEHKMHFTEIVEYGVLMFMGEKFSGYSWHILKPEFRELAETFAEFMQAETSEVQSGVKHMMRVVLKDFAARQIAAG